MGDQEKIYRVLKIIEFLTQNRFYSIERLMEQFDISRATAYRYLNLLEALNYDLIKNEKGFKISGINQGNTFTDEHKKIITSLIRAIPKQSLAHQEILYKLKYDAHIKTPDIIRFENKFQMASQLITCCKTKTPVTLKNYKSTNIANLPKDRRVIALDFIEHKLSLIAFEIENKEVKLFKVDRMDSIEVIEEDINIDITKIKLPSIDNFDWLGYEKHKVELLLTDLAAQVIKEEYPNTEKQITRHSDPKYKYKYRDTLSGYTAISRFIAGLYKEIRIVKDEALIKRVKERMK